MSTPGTLINCDAALRQIDRIPDPVTRTLVNMAFVHVVTKMHLEGAAPPTADFDMRFFVTTLTDFFAEHDVLSRALEGEKVGAWFEDELQPAAGTGPSGCGR